MSRAEGRNVGVFQQTLGPTADSQWSHLPAEGTHPRGPAPLQGHLSVCLSVGREGEREGSSSVFSFIESWLGLGSFDIFNLTPHQAG